MDERSATAGTPEAQLRAVLDSVSDCYYALDRSWRIVEFNRAAEEYFGLQRENVIGKDLWDLYPVGRGQPYEELCRDAMDRGLRGRMEAPSDFRPGNTVELRTAPMDGGISVVLTDITERRRVEAELRTLTADLERRIAAAVTEREVALNQLHEAQKTEALGQITGGVAHDFNNLLTPVLGGLDILQRRGVGDARDQRLIDAAIQSAERARTLVLRLLAFARRQPLQPKAVEIAHLLTGMHELLISSVGARVRVTVDAVETLAPAFVDANQLELALLNLALNARDAMPDGGALTFAARQVATTDVGGIAPGDYISLTVTDTGAGMDATTLRRAVEPFFSTKGIGKGTGLGLSMVHGLAAQMGGALDITSHLGVGTTVTLLLPVASGAAPAATAAPQEQAPPVGAVLLVDDEAIVRESTREMLLELGYAVVEAASGAEALALVDGGLHLDWLVTDFMMPGMTGADLARAVRERRPATRVLIISGYANVEDIAPDLPRLAKPFRQAELAQGLTLS